MVFFSMVSMGNIYDITRAVWFNQVTRYSYGLVAGSAATILLSDVSPAAKVFASLMGSFGLLGVMATRSGWETLDRYYDIKEVITRGHLDQLGQAFMPCSRGAVHMLIDDYKNDPKIKKSLESLLVKIF